MRCSVKSVTLIVVCFTACFLALASVAGAQAITTGTISGTIVDAQGGVLPGASIVAVHTPTGTSYEGVTNAEGHFTLLNVRVGGPYTIAAKLAGFTDESIKAVNVALGEDRAVKITLKVANITETVQVSAEALQILSLHLCPRPGWRVGWRKCRAGVSP